MVESIKTGSEEFGDAVRRARERLGMSRRDLAETTGLSYPYISQIETGYRMPSTPAMRSLADALGLRPDRLFDAIPPVAGRDAASAPAAPSTPAPHTPAPHTPAPHSGSAALTAGAAPAPTPAAAASPAPPVGDGVAAARSTGRVWTDSAAAGAPIDATAPAARADSTSDGAPTDVAAGPGGGWIPNRGFRPVAARAGAAPDTVGNRGHAVDGAVALLTSLPTDERLPALTEVQARVVRSVIEDEVRRDGVRSP